MECRADGVANLPRWMACHRRMCRQPATTRLRCRCVVSQETRKRIRQLEAAVGRRPARVAGGTDRRRSSAPGLARRPPRRSTHGRSHLALPLLTALAIVVGPLPHRRLARRVDLDGSSSFGEADIEVRKFCRVRLTSLTAAAIWRSSTLSIASAVNEPSPFFFVCAMRPGVCDAAR